MLNSHSSIEEKNFNFFVEFFIENCEMSESETASGLVSMPTLQYNEEGWGPHEISEDFRAIPYQVINFCKMVQPSINEWAGLLNSEIKCPTIRMKSTEIIYMR